MATEQQETSDMDTVADVDYAIGDRVSTLMRRVRHTRKSFGAVLQVGESAMSLKLNGKRPWSAAEVARAANALDVKVAVLYGELPMPEPTRPAPVTTLDPSRNANKQTTDYGYEASAPISLADRRAQKVAS